MHAFGLLALVRGAGADASPGVLTSIRDAAHWLVDRQNDDGSLGLPLATGRFDHPVAALALVEAAALTGDPGLHEAAARALRHLEQQRNLLWRRGRETGQATWILAALVRADQLGWGGLGGSIERGRLALGPQAVVLMNGDFLREAPFWSLALAGNGPPRGETVDDLFTASLAVLAPELR
jgi:hypothetical protein